MKTLRLILFIPAFILTLILVKFFFVLAFYIGHLFIPQDSETVDVFSLIGGEFIKAVIISSAGIYVGILVYPFRNSLFPIIIFSLLYLLAFISLFTFFNNYWEFLSVDNRDIAIVGQISNTAGTLAGTGYFWYNYYKNDGIFFKDL